MWWCDVASLELMFSPITVPLEQVYSTCTTEVCQQMKNFPFIHEHVYFLCPRESPVGWTFVKWFTVIYKVWTPKTTFINIK